MKIEGKVSTTNSTLLYGFVPTSADDPRAVQADPNARQRKSLPLLPAETVYAVGSLSTRVGALSERRFVRGVELQGSSCLAINFLSVFRQASGT